jgi:heat shock protein HtpX
MYEQIARNKRASALLVVAMTLFLALVGGVFARAAAAPAGVGVAAAFAVALVTGLISYYGGASILMGVSSARQIEKADQPQLFNVVEEMAIASGLPMPAIYVIDDTAPNAFATGRDPRHAAVAVTRGLLEKLNRSELQGVIAHELAHVRNRDILLSMLLAVMVGSVALLCDFFWRNVGWGIGGRRSSGRDDNNSGQLQILFFVLALILAVVAPVAAKLIELAVSRQREYLADATAVELTRYPDGLAAALKKIDEDRDVLEVANRATQHLYIVNPIKSFEERASKLFSTHPPTAERIRRLGSMSYRSGVPLAAETPSPGEV